MDHIRISGNEPSSVSFAKQSSFKNRNIDPKMSKQAEAKRDGVIKPQN